MKQFLAKYVKILDILPTRPEFDPDFDPEGKPDPTQPDFGP